jgi:hypothetical protein
MLRLQVTSGGVEVPGGPGDVLGMPHCAGGAREDLPDAEESPDEKGRMKRRRKLTWKAAEAVESGESGEAADHEASAPAALTVRKGDAPQTTGLASAIKGLESLQSGHIVSPAAGVKCSNGASSPSAKQQRSGSLESSTMWFPPAGSFRVIPPFRKSNSPVRSSL